MSENSKSAAFSMSSEQAVQVLCAALQGGAIKLPFGGVIDQETLNKYLDSGDYRSAVVHHGKDGQHIASCFASRQLSIYSQADVVYLTMLFIGLQRGLTDKELSEFFISAAQK